MSGFGAASAGRILVAVIIVWILLIFFIGGPIFRRSTDSDLTGSNGETGTELILARLSRASSELKSLRAQNEELRKIIDHLIPLKSSSSSSSHLKSSPSDDHQLDHHETLSSSDHVLHSTVPNHSYEDSRRRLYSNINEEWFYLRKRLNVTDLKFLTQLRHNLLYDLDEISLRDKKWRTSEYQKLSGLMDSVIHKLQNPASCDKAPKLVCQLNKGCGFGCQIHHVVYCFVVALATDRTLILDAKNWRYVDHKTRKSKTAGWNLVFKQLSETCLDESGSSRSSWKSGDHTTQVLDLPIIDSLRPRPDFLPLAIPQQISDRIEKMHGLPIAWFLGHLTKYIMRLSPDMEAFVAEAKARFNFKRPIVGVHVRRTDKVGSEAAYHPLSEYMALVSDYYDQLDLYQERNGSDAKVERNVYLATDDPGIWRKETNKYEDKGFFFMGDSDIGMFSVMSYVLMWYSYFLLIPNYSSVSRNRNSIYHRLTA